MTYTKAQLQVIMKVLGKHQNISAAIPEINRVLKMRATEDSLRHGFRKSGVGQMRHFLARKAPIVEVAAASAAGAKFARLVELVRKPVSVSELCDKLDMSPSRVAELVVQARAEGVKVHVENDHVGIKLAEPLERVQETKISPTVGQRQSIAVISDTHLGSKYCLRDQLRDFVHYAAERGVREVLHVGDVLDGDYRHGKFEMTHMGIDEQTRDLDEVLPRIKGLSYHGITGNHDHTFTSSVGVDAGEYIESYFDQAGRGDFKFYGNRGAYLKIRGILVHLWHPRSGGAYAVSYPLQKKLEGYSAIKPQVLLAGHWHKYAHIYERGVEAIACPCFQAGQSEFSKSMTNAPAIGGMILSYVLTRDGTIREFSIEKRNYFERERPLEIVNDLDAIPVEVGHMAPRRGGAGKK